MRLARLFVIGLIPVGLAGCLHEADRPTWMNRIPLLGHTPEPGTAALTFVLVERPAGGEEINHEVWNRTDELIVPFETRLVLEATGLRVGIASESTPGPLRKLIDDPRTGRGHRLRTFALDKPAPLLVGGEIPYATFPMPSGEDRSIKFARADVALGFELTVRDGPDGKVLVKLVPHAKFRDGGRLLPGADGERDTETEHFPAAGFEVALAPTEFLVIGTEFYREGTFGHAALTGLADERPVQRLLVLRAGQTRAEPADQTTQAALPIASQATAARGARP